ncbi:MAG: fluoride efflux transporter CrcB [Ferruginibacter sp.]
MLKNLLIVGLGGGIGSMARYSVSLFISFTDFPTPTFLINITGSLIIGFLFGLGFRDSFPGWKLFLVIGICGGFTTFSAFSFENLSLLQNGKYFLAFLYISLSVIFGIAAAFLGMKLGEILKLY